jgi:hypothetical protein
MKAEMIKQDIAHQILSNPVYRSDSGMYKQAHAGLTKLSVTTLKQISWIVRFSRSEGARKMRRKQERNQP